MNAFTSRIGIEHPIVQGPFGGGLSSVRLAAAVSNAGGLGSFGAHHLSPNEMREVIHDLQRATAKPCNINLWVSRHDAGAEVMTSEHHARGLRQFAPIYERLGIAVLVALTPLAAFNRLVRLRAAVRTSLDLGAVVRRVDDLYVKIARTHAPLESLAERAQKTEEVLAAAEQSSAVHLEHWRRVAATRD